MSLWDTGPAFTVMQAQLWYFGKPATWTSALTGIAVGIVVVVKAPAQAEDITPGSYVAIEARASDVAGWAVGDTFTVMGQAYRALPAKAQPDADAPEVEIMLEKI